MQGTASSIYRHRPPMQGTTSNTHRHLSRKAEKEGLPGRLRRHVVSMSMSFVL